MTESPLDQAMLVDRFIELYRAGAYAEALRQIDAAIPRFPERAAQFLAWRAALLALLGRTGDALAALQSADAAGFWYAERAMRGDPDFAALQGMPLFDQLVERFSARQAAAERQLRAARALSVPAGPGPHPLGLVLHGNSSNIAETQPRWLPITGHGWALACLQSSQPAWTGGVYVWNDVPRALDEIQGHLAELAADPALDSKRVIAAGFSMGAHAAVRMALDPRFSLRGVIAHEAWFNEEAMSALEETVRKAALTPARIALIAGTGNAEYEAMADQLHALLSARGFTSRRFSSSNPRHGYPPDFDRTLAEVMDWVVTS